MRRFAFAAAVILFGCGPSPTIVRPSELSLMTNPSSSAAPMPAPAPAPVIDAAPVTDGDVTVARVHGVDVLVKRIPGAELAAMQLCIRGGARNVSAADAGIERLALRTAIAGGTSALDKDAYFRKLAALGSNIGALTNPDYASLTGKTLTQHWDKTFEILVDTFLRPALPASEFELQKQRQIAALRSEDEDPDATLSVLAHRVLFAKHPFENRSIGTEATVSKLTHDAVNVHLAKLRESGRLLFVTVGDVNPEHVIERVKAAFGGLPTGTYGQAPYPSITFDKPSLQITERKLSTNYIQASFSAPRWGNPEFVDGMIAIDLLRSHLFEQVRTKRNLSYAPGATFSTNHSVPTGYLYVTATDPNTTLRVMFDEVRKLQDEPVSEDELAGAKATFLTRYLMQGESSDAQAEMLAAAFLLGGDWKFVRTLPERVRAVTPGHIQAFAKTYMRRFQTVVLGDPSKIDGALFTSL
jgi:zinc protease